ncbi:MAG: FtsW/RodA/SpoVE family cell cycle protein [Aggregatilineales bacterium]
MSNPLAIWRRFDLVLFGVTIALMIFGILMIRSATLDAVDTDLISRVPDQILYGTIGVVLIFVLTAVDYRLLGGVHMWLYLALMILLLLVPIIGTVGDAGARRWINVGILIQPSELGKIIIVIGLGHWLSERFDQMDKLTTVLGSMLYIAPVVALIFIQPDLGTTIVFGVLWFTLVWAAGLRIRHIVIFVVVGVISAPLIWSQMQPYQQQRITNFVLPAEDVDEDRGSRYNIIQAEISISSGGIFGKGYANGTQNIGRFLRVRHTDFIFSVIAEEFGLLGGLTVMSLIGIVIFRILRGARLAIDPLGSMICYGIAAMIFFQTVVSIGMNLGLLPVTGLTLPFISSGGTSLLSMLTGVGLAQSVIVRRRRVS